MYVGCDMSELNMVFKEDWKNSEFVYFYYVFQ